MAKLHYSYTTILEVGKKQTWIWIMIYKKHPIILFLEVYTSIIKRGFVFSSVCGTQKSFRSLMLRGVGYAGDLVTKYPKESLSSWLCNISTEHPREVYKALARSMDRCILMAFLFAILIPSSGEYNFLSAFFKLDCRFKGKLNYSLTS